MKKLILRGIAACLCMTILLPLAGCNKKKKEPRKRVVQETDPYFSCEDILLDFESPEGKVVERRAIGQIKIFSNCIVVETLETYVMPVEFKKQWSEYRENWLKYSEEERKKMDEEYESYRRGGLSVFSLDGKMKGFSYIPSGKELVGLVEDPSGKAKALLSSYNGNGYNSTMVLYDISPEGRLIESITLDRDEHNLVTDMLFMENGNFLCNDVSTLLLFSPEGKLLNEEPIFNSISRIFQIEGKYYAYVSIDDVYDPSNPPIAYMYEIDPVTGKKVGDKIDVTGRINGDKLIQGSDAVYATVGNGIQKYNLLSSEDPQMILSWSDTDNRYRETHWDPQIRLASDNDIYMACHSHDGIALNFENISEDVHLLHMHREEKNPHAGKNILYLAFIGDLRRDFANTLTAYNLDPAKKTRIVVQDYSGESSLYTGMYQLVVSSTEEQSLIADQVYLEILAGDGPDILMNFGSFSQFNTERALVDLNTLIDGSDPLDRSLFFDNIFRSYERNGKLYQLPLNFSVNGMVANTEYVGERTGWTYDEFEEISRSLPENISILGKVSQSDLMETLLNGTTSHFLDYDNRKVVFDDPEFAKILDLVKNHGLPMTSGELQKSYLESEIETGNNMHPQVQFDAGMIVALSQSIHSLNDFGHMRTLCDGKVCFVGNPSIDGRGAMAEKSTSLAISQTSPLKSEAWDIIRYFLEYEPQLYCGRYYFRFPVNRKAFDMEMELSLKENRLGWEDPDKESYMIYESAHLSEDDVTELKKVIGNIHDSCSSDPSAMMIIQEEAPGYFIGDRTLDDVVKNIQKRSKAVVQERG
ncbi:MAG: extracellular solute-binding protein [Clostridiales bacterium]|nr:extracellular solute-binding protein [Clostridiales bacterium]